MKRGILVLALGLAAVAGGQQMPTIRVPVRLVNLPTLVLSRDGRLLRGLTAADFRVLDNGRLRAVTLATASAPASIALVVQANQDVREYTRFIAKTGSVVDALLVGELGEAAVVAYGSEITVAKRFETGDAATALRSVSGSGGQARMIDAGMRAATLLAGRPGARNRVLLFIGQPADRGSEFDLASLRRRAEKDGVLVYALTLPEFGKAFVSDTFSLQGVSREEKGGFRASVDLLKLVSVLKAKAGAEAGADPFSVLTAATGGVQLHVRTQRELEEAIGAVGDQLRSGYLLSYYANPEEAGYHTITVEVAAPGAKVYSRPGYWLSGN